MQDDVRPYVKEPMGHVWRKDGEGVDICGYDRGWHNGPVCEVCGYGFCEYCQDLPSFECEGQRSIYAEGDEECQS